MNNLMALRLLPGGHNSRLAVVTRHQAFVILAEDSDSNVCLVHLTGSWLAYVRQRPH
jgi:hypothetical protein